jgi:hypothetical protein
MDGAYNLAFTPSYQREDPNLNFRVLPIAPASLNKCSYLSKITLSTAYIWACHVLEIARDSSLYIFMKVRSENSAHSFLHTI